MPGGEYARAFVAAMRTAEGSPSPTRGSPAKRPSPPLTPALPAGGATPSGLGTDPGSPVSVLLAHALWRARPSTSSSSLGSGVGVSGAGGGSVVGRPAGPLNVLSVETCLSACSCASGWCGEEEEAPTPLPAWSVLAAPATPPALTALLAAATHAVVAGVGACPLNTVKLYAHLGAGAPRRGATGPPTLPRHAWHRAHLHAKTVLGWSSAGRQERLHVTVADATAGGATTVLTLVLASPSASGAGALQSLRQGHRIPLAEAVAVVAPAAADGWSPAHRVSGRLVVDVVSAVEPAAPSSAALLRLAAACVWHAPPVGSIHGGAAPAATSAAGDAVGAAPQPAGAPVTVGPQQPPPPSLGALTFVPGYRLPPHLSIVDVARVSKERLLGEWEGVHYAATFSAVAGVSGVATVLKVTPDMAVAGGGVANLAGSAVDGLAAVIGVLGAAAGGGGVGVGGPMWETPLALGVRRGGC